MLAEYLQGTFKGNARQQISGVARPIDASATDLIFVDDAAFVEQAIASKAGVILSTREILGSVLDSSRNFLLVGNPRLAFARAAKLILASAPRTSSIHPTAVIDPSAKLGNFVSIGAYTMIGANVIIGDDCSIGPGCTLISDITLGRACELVARVTIYPKTTIGARAVIHAGVVLGSDGFGFARDSDSGAYEKFPQIGSLVIGDDFEIGANSTIDRGALTATVIGNGVKLDNLVHLAHNVEVGDNVVIAAQTGVSGSSIIERNCIVAGQVGIADHVRIEEGAILGAQCGVPTKKVIRGKGVVFWGTPARPIAEYLRELAALARLARRKKTESKSGE